MTRRPAPAIREPSTLSRLDSLQLTTAAARTLFPDARRATSCVTQITTSLRSQAGKAFVKVGTTAARKLPPATDSAGTEYTELLTVRDGDTATVLMTHGGTHGTHMWVNSIDHYFVRDTLPGGWRYLRSQLMGASDYVITESPSRKLKCLNGRQR